MTVEPQTAGHLEGLRGGWTAAAVLAAVAMGVVVGQLTGRAPDRLCAV